MAGESIDYARVLSRASGRLQQVLMLTLAGESEKRIGMLLGISRHTVHVYTKRLYQIYKVSGRWELMALGIRLVRAEAEDESCQPVGRQWEYWPGC